MPDSKRWDYEIHRKKKPKAGAFRFLGTSMSSSHKAALNETAPVYRTYPPIIQNQHRQAMMECGDPVDVFDALTSERLGYVQFNGVRLELHRKDTPIPARQQKVSPMELMLQLDRENREDERSTGRRPTYYSYKDLPPSLKYNQGPIDQSYTSLNFNSHDRQSYSEREQRNMSEAETYLSRMPTEDRRFQGTVRDPRSSRSASRPLSRSADRRISEYWRDTWRDDGNGSQDDDYELIGGRYYL